MLTNKAAVTATIDPPHKRTNRLNSQALVSSSMIPNTTCIMDIQRPGLGRYVANRGMAATVSQGSAIPRPRPGKIPGGGVGPAPRQTATAGLKTGADHAVAGGVPTFPARRYP